MTHTPKHIGPATGQPRTGYQVPLGQWVEHDPQQALLMFGDYCGGTDPNTDPSQLSPGTHLLEVDGEPFGQPGTGLLIESVRIAPAEYGDGTIEVTVWIGSRMAALMLDGAVSTITR